jgi:pyruvate/2-oxoacid:ferredoxin oxidoreductase alpha subunit
MMPVDIPSQEEVDTFLPPYQPAYRLDPEAPVNINPVVMTDPIPNGEGTKCPGYMGFRHRLQESFESSWPVISQAARTFAEVCGRFYEDCLYRYKTEDADFLFVTMGSLSSEAGETVDLLRKEGVKAGVIGIRVYRPFPAETLARAVEKATSIAVVEKAISYGYEGAVATELKAALFSSNGHRPALSNYIVGLGGKDVKPADLFEIAQDTIQTAARGIHQERPHWVGYEV